ncbi:hypothetical protein [Lactococcus cremoris]|jgi:hypothetical protein|uniref:Uncharacterized protein n=1 Tax=Lactococcus cremoris subsp. cremoris IBB477 TaxID=1449093 RepID=A0A1E7G2D2_LACLC|nr:hypothetical protein [Lactococcus cremoris]MCT0457086.1 hypothetical protein [Lactococcus cremoris]MCT0478027.1 hypothetical protein [Lactococcus cremoris]MCT0500264.1 hypothetical protein [Lactococcus cremoris]MCT0509152.1 hypothetical protein [Lactococcus cremoris]OEU39103.1 hypothetical protein AJ89_10265 [Lactococcus cremoris subsp. cremoris IBB477]
MKKIGKNKIILTLSSLAILAGVSTIALASQSYKKTSNTASASAITKTSISAGPENSASRKEAGRDSFPDEESYLNYKKMRDEVKEGELIVEHQTLISQTEKISSEQRVSLLLKIGVSKKIIPAINY